MDEIIRLLQEGKSIDYIISYLKNKSISVPSWLELLLDYEPKFHRIVDDKVTLKDKVRKDGSVEKSARLIFALEKLLTKRMTEFMFAIPPKRVYHNIEGNETRQKIAKAIEAIYKYARIDSENIKRGTAYFASCEICTVWYAVEKPNTFYGFNSKYKLKCKTYSPMDGVDLYPLFDEYDDMLAMSFEYKKTIGDKSITFFETYTATKHYKWKIDGASIEEVINEDIKLLKIPAIYGYRPVPIYDGLRQLREDLEYTVSRNSNVIAYNSAPILKVAGGIQGEEDKGESKRVYRVMNGGDVSYVSWAQSIEALKYHVETLLKMFWMQAQMPDVSFDNLKTLGSIGYDARQMMLTDAHMKVGDESGPILEFLEREGSVVKAFLKLMNTSWEKEVDNVEIEHIITPFIQNDETAMIDRLQKGNGGKPIFSQLDSIRMGGFSNDPEATLAQIQKEETDAAMSRMSNLFESAQ